MPHEIEPIDLAKYRLEQARECLIMKIFLWYQNPKWKSR